MAKRSAASAGLKDREFEAVKVPRFDTGPISAPRAPVVPYSKPGKRKWTEEASERPTKRARHGDWANGEPCESPATVDVASAALHFVYAFYQRINAQLTELEMLRRWRRHDDEPDAGAATSVSLAILVN